MLTKERLQEIISRKDKTAEESIIATLFPIGALKLDSICEKLPYMSRSQVLLHIRKSSYLDHNFKSGIVKLNRKGRIHQDILTDWTQGITIQQIVMSYLWKHFDIKYESLISIIEPICRLKGLNLSMFKKTKSNYQWYKKTVKKNALSIGHKLTGVEIV